MKMILMSNFVNCKFSIVNIVNIDDIDGTRVDTNMKWIMLLILMANVRMLNFKHFVLIDVEILFTQPGNYVKELLPNPFLSENFFYPTHFSLVPTPL